MPPRMFRNVYFVAIMTVATIGSMVHCSLTVLWPVILDNVYTTNSMQVGWQSCVVGGGILLGQTIAGFCITFIPKVKWQCVIVASLALALITSLTTISPDRRAATIALGTLGCTGRL